MTTYNPSIIIDNNLILMIHDYCIVLKIGSSQFVTFLYYVVATFTTPICGDSAAHSLFVCKRLRLQRQQMLPVPDRC